MKQYVVDENGTVMADILFNSPSAAACFVAGASVNGNTYWKDKNGTMLKDIDSGSGNN